MHLIQSIENLDIAIDTTKSFRDQVENAVSLQQNLRIQSELYTLERELMCVKRRSESLHQRFQNEINLVNSSPSPLASRVYWLGWRYQAFNIVAQNDSRIVVKMGEHSRIESSNMTTIAIVGLLFLPGTFISVCLSYSYPCIMRCRSLWLSGWYMDRACSGWIFLISVLRTRAGQYQRSFGSTAW